VFRHYLKNRTANVFRASEKLILPPSETAAK